MGDWIYRGKPFSKPPDEFVGFVYIIRNLDDGRSYVGKKLFAFSGKKKVRGRKRCVRVQKASDWMTYYGSSDELKGDVEKLGQDRFSREILHLCRTKAECSYLELREQVVRNCLLDDGFYNRWIRYRGTKKHLERCRESCLHRAIDSNNDGR